MIDNEKLAAIRRDYSSRLLLEREVAADPLEQFRKWFAEALTAEVNEPNAMHLATVNEQGRPEGRIVLLKGIEEGFSFFTNYNSAKGKQLERNPYAALTFFWPELERQVRIEGKTEKLSSEENDRYFLSRPRGSRVGAWVSDQSEVIASREWLEAKLLEFEQRFAGKEVERPAHWGGFRLVPDSIEFWQGRPSRLHDRLLYNLQPGHTWEISRLSP